MKNKKPLRAFTLIELIIAITITSLVLVSIVEIFMFSNTFSRKVDISRIMQENIKNLTEIIAEDVRINGIITSPSGKLYYSGGTLKTLSGEYYLANYDKNTDNYIKLNDFSKCKNSFKKEDRCILVRESGGETNPVVNSWIAFEYLKFYISSGTIDGKNGIPKVTMVYTIRPASGKGLGTSKIKNDKIKYQTTFSQRLYKYK